MNEETTKLLKCMLTFLESRKSVINVVVEYNRSIGNKEEEMLSKGRVVELGCIISELKNDLGINCDNKVSVWDKFKDKKYDIDNYGFPSKEEADLWMDSKPAGEEEI